MMESDSGGNGILSLLYEFSSLNDCSFCLNYKLLKDQVIMKNYLQIKWMFLALLFIWMMPNVNAQTDNVITLFDSDEVLNLELNTNLARLVNDREEKEGYIEGIVRYEEGQKVELPVEVKVRGNYRLKEETCSFPPLKLKFAKGDIDKTIFEHNRKIKLVTHCNEDSAMVQSVFREYLAYRLYNVISETSLKVRLVKIAYSDLGGGEGFTQYGFLIEDVDDLCDRLDMKEQKVMNVTLDQVNRDEMLRMTMFQYLIGNEDWSVPKCHNIALVQNGKHDAFIAVPYDFDMSAFVNPPYRVRITGPNEYEQAYKGNKVEFDYLLGAADIFLDKKSEIQELILSMSHLPVKCRQKCLQKVDDFFAKLESKNTIRRNFIVRR